jgi:glutathione synthase
VKIAFCFDPLDQLKAYKDSSIAMMRAATARGHQIYAFEPREMYSTGQIAAQVRRLAVREGNEDWYQDLGQETHALDFFDAVLMRQDPPFDMEYFYSTLLLEQAQAQGARVFNDPRALRDYNEKFAIARFPQFTVPMLVTRDMERVHAFIDGQSDTILKKLDGMGGMAIFRVKKDDPNRNAIVEMQTALGTQTIMAQRFIPEIAQGDKRILIIAGKPVPHCLARIPKPGETRGNLAAGGRGVAQPLSTRDREIAEAMGPQLLADGLIFVGIDVIGDYLTEVNVTSPTCMVEIFEQTGFNSAALFVEAIETACRSGR